MTEAELWELNAIYISSSIDAAGMYLTVTFAYIAAAYFVGAKLTRLQVSLISGLYVFAASSATAGCVLFLRRSVTFQEMLAPRAEAYGRELIASLGFWSGYMGAILSVGVFVSLYFMYDVRKTSS
jgi:hypothetical protein